MMMMMMMKKRRRRREKKRLRLGKETEEEKEEGARRKENKGGRDRLFKDSLERSSLASGKSASSLQLASCLWAPLFALVTTENTAGAVMLMMSLSCLSGSRVAARSRLALLCLALLELDAHLSSATAIWWRHI